MLTQDTVNSLKNTLSNTNDAPASVVNSISDTVSSTLQNPIAASLKKVLSRINTVTANVETKITKLVDNIAKSSDNKAKIELIGSNIVITVKPEDLDVLSLQQQRIQSNINSVTTTLHLLKSSVNTLNTINETIKVLRKVLDIQEILISTNPLTKAAFEVFKKGIKIVFLKDMLTQYAKIVDTQLTSNEATLSSLIDRFDNLRVQVKVTDESNIGNNISDSEAQGMISQELLSAGNDSVSEDFFSENGKPYLLKVEKFDNRKLIGRAYEKITNQLVQQTAPSIVSTSAQLIDELKSILNKTS